MDTACMSWCRYPYLGDIDDVQLALELRKLTSSGHDIRLNEMRLGLVAILEHLEAHVPEIDDVEAVQVLGGSTVVHQVAQIVADETADVC